jgi:ubiquinone/menaquinone biosynthesis C-methylase UbiE
VAQVGQFAQLDKSDNPRYFVDFLDMVDRIPQLPEARRHTYAAMGIGSGSYVLDVGCGPGTAAMEMAELVGESGRVEGVDLSDVMIAEARARCVDKGNVKFAVSGASHLPYADDLFDAVRMERVLLYVHDRERALAEMIRVTKPGGRVVVADVDFEAVATFSRDRLLTRRMTGLIADECVHPASGRELPHLLTSVGLKDVTVSFSALSAPYEFCLHVSSGALRSAIERDKVTQGEVDSWLQKLGFLEDAGQFFQSWPVTIVSGVVVETFVEP